MAGDEGLLVSVTEEGSVHDTPSDILLRTVIISEDVTLPVPVESISVEGTVVGVSAISVSCCIE